MDAAIQYFLGRDKERSAEAAATPPPPASSSTSSGPSTTTSQAAASTVLPPRKPTAPNFSALVRGRPMGPRELQAQIRRLMSPPARPAAPAVSSVRDQRPSVPPPPTTEVTDEELVRMVTDVEMADA
ncbi:disintegrin and metalloproteinase domain-containing protein 15-like isoform X2 [Gadus chalcogrammus]|uniref:disintegrin and metalloproteinase domain-containing protein 15-like isoform X2 n=1 Tax=Gadus chalcogrammus TaxID=1042646 RepID=UPI0024C22052|nr:disintegrin and metalloproteinase domain-containing protein 15-like isoform X2 [Gadus chalcogrammus]